MKSVEEQKQQKTLPKALVGDTKYFYTQYCGFYSQISICQALQK
jgi:hypothetical protein